MQIKFFKMKKVFKKESFTINPDIYWRYILFVSFILIFSFFVFDFYVFKQTNKDLNFSIDNLEMKEVNTVKERLNNALLHFSNREKKSTRILNNPAPVVDPSL